MRNSNNFRFHKTSPAETRHVRSQKKKSNSVGVWSKQGKRELIAKLRTKVTKQSIDAIIMMEIYKLVVQWISGSLNKHHFFPPLKLPFFRVHIGNRRWVWNECTYSLTHTLIHLNSILIDWSFYLSSSSICTDWVESDMVKILIFN